MEKKRITSLKAGQVFEQSIFSLAGQKLLNAGVTLSERHVEAIQRCGDLEVFIAESVEELAQAGVLSNVDKTKLAVGQKATANLVTRTGQIVVEADEEIEAHHLDALDAGGGAFAQAKQASQRRERIMVSDELVEELDEKLSQVDLRVTQHNKADWIKPADPATWPDPEHLTGFRNDAVDKLRKLYARIEAGVSAPYFNFSEIVEDLVSRLSKHPTRFTQLALLCPRREDYVPDHSYTVTVLAMAIGAQLKWSIDDVRQVGYAGLLYDLGMLLVPERIRTGGCELTEIDRSRVQRHPIFTLAMLQSVDGTPPVIKLAAMQHHERENGSGYPRGTRKDAMCDYARVLAVADAYAATTEPRHYRKQKLPYIAMEETLRSASAMAFWKPAVRALLQAAGLFPVGSYVKLSTGLNAHVIASNPNQLDKPVVQPLETDGTPAGPSLDLANEKTITVVRPIPGPTG